MLNGLCALRELAGVERIAQSGKVLGDEALLRLVGFQAEQIEAARADGSLCVDPETLILWPELFRDKNIRPHNQVRQGISSNSQYSESSPKHL